MSLDMSPEQKAIGRSNFQRVVGKLAEPQPAGQEPTRRDFMRNLIAAGATAPVAAAAYFGYSNSSFSTNPVKAGLIGAGDEGGVLVGEHNPAYLEFIAFSDIRPSNFRERIFRGEPTGPRRGLNFHYGNDSNRRIRHYLDYKELLRNPDIQAVVIAVPLHLHAQVTLDALAAGKHVLCEKLMAWNIRDCKRMIQAAQSRDLLLSVGHQRHYSMLYAHATEVLNSGALGDIRHIRALWHRNNVRPIEPAQRVGDRIYLDSWRPVINQADQPLASDTNRLREYGYKNLNELVRWRLYKRTGGGLMAELGSHQLDACSIFLGKRRDHDVFPIAVTAVGGKHFYQDDREVEDHVYCVYEFPGRSYRPQQPLRNARGHCEHNDIVTVTYSSINTNAFEPYGECVMGARGTLVLEGEQIAMVWGGPRPGDATGRSTSVTVTTTGGQPALSSSDSVTAPGERRAEGAGQNALGHGPPSRGYREEMEHFAYCIRMRNEGSARDREDLRPRCDGKAAMGDAIIALTANEAMRAQQRVVFDRRWFDPAVDDVPPWDPVPETI